MTTERKTVFVSISGPQQSGRTTLAELLYDRLSDIRNFDVKFDGEVSGRHEEDLVSTLVRLYFADKLSVVVRETEYDDRDRELAGLRLRVPRLEQEVEQLRAKLSREPKLDADGLPENHPSKIPHRDRYGW